MSGNNEVTVSSVLQNRSGMVSDNLVARITLQGALLLQNRAGQILQTESCLQDLRSKQQLQREIGIVWVPSEKVVISQVKVPGKRKAHWLAALPYVLEENLTEPLEEYHFVAFERDKDETVSVAIIRHEDMQSWHAVLEQHGLLHAQLVADCFRLEFNHSENAATSHPAKTPETVWVKSLDSQRVLLRNGLYSGFAADSQWLSVLEEQLQHQLDQSLTINNAPLLEPERLASSHRQNLAKLGKMSLSQAPYQAMKTKNAGWFKWPWLVAIALLSVLMLVANQALETHRLQNQVVYTKSKSEALFNKLFPHSKRIVNIKVQTLSNINSVPVQSVRPLMPILQRVALWFRQANKVQVKSLSWNPQQQKGFLSFKVSAAQTADLQKLIKLSQRQSLAKQPGLVNQKISLRLTLNNVTANLAEGEIYVDAD